MTRPSNHRPATRTNRRRRPHPAARARRIVAATSVAATAGIAGAMLLTNLSGSATAIGSLTTDVELNTETTTETTAATDTATSIATNIAADVTASTASTSTTVAATPAAVAETSSKGS